MTFYADIRRLGKKKKVTVDLVGFHKYSPDISVSFHRGMVLRHRHDGPGMFRPVQHVLSSWQPKIANFILSVTLLIS